MDGGKWCSQSFTSLGSGVAEELPAFVIDDLGPAAKSGSMLSATGKRHTIRCGLVVTAFMEDAEQVSASRIFERGLMLSSGLIPARFGEVVASPERSCMRIEASPITVLGDPNISSAVEEPPPKPLVILEILTCQRPEHKERSKAVRLA